MEFKMRLKPRTHFTKYRFTTEMGDVFETNSLALFCKEFNLNRPSITNLSKGRLRTYKGFRFVGKDVANFVMTNTETGEDHKVMAIVPFAKLFEAYQLSTNIGKQKKSLLIQRLKHTLSVSFKAPTSLVVRR